MVDFWFFTNRRARETPSKSVAGHCRLILLGTLGCAKSEQPQMRPPEVAVVRVEQEDVPIFKAWVGTFDGLVNAQIRAQVAGYLLRQNYHEGSEE